MDDQSQPQDLLSFFKVHERFCKVLLDAYVLVDLKGELLKFNSMLAQTLGIKSRQIKNSKSLERVLSLEWEGRPLSLEKMAVSNRNRFDHVRAKSLLNEGSEDLLLVIGLQKVVVAGETLGFFLVIRDITAESALEGKYQEKAAKSIRDALTGLFNRQYFQNYLDTQVASLQASQSVGKEVRDLSLVLIDIDFFKSVNDKYGHTAGDEVLKKVAKLLEQGTRQTDVASRYGGEEFLLILPQTDHEGACIVAEKVRQLIANEEFSYNGQKLEVTISAGVATHQLGKEDVQKTLSRADVALYFCKDNGRNQVSFHDGQAATSYPVPMLKSS